MITPTRPTSRTTASIRWRSEPGKASQEIPSGRTGFESSALSRYLLLSIDKPDHDKAVRYFREALNDPKLDIREETLVKLGQSLYDGGMQSEGEAKKKKLSEAAKAFGAFLEEFSDGSYADQATFMRRGRINLGSSTKPPIFSVDSSISLR